MLPDKGNWQVFREEGTHQSLTTAAVHDGVSNELWSSLSETGPLSPLTNYHWQYSFGRNEGAISDRIVVC